MIPTARRAAIPIYNFRIAASPSHCVAFHSFSPLCESSGQKSPMPSRLVQAIKQGNLSLAQHAFKQMRSEHFERWNHKTLSQLLMLARKGRRPADLDFVKDVVHWMEKTKTLKPSHFDYHALIYAYGVHRRPDEALHALDRMRQHGIEPTIYSFNTVLSCFKRTKELHKALDVFEAIPLQPDTTSFNIMIHAFAQNGQADKAVELYKRMLAQNVKPDMYTYATILSCTTKNNQPIRKDIYQTLMQDPGNVDTKAFNAMLSFQKDDLNAVLDLYYSHKDTFLKTKVDAATFNILVDVCLKHRNPAKAMAMVREMKASGIQPDIITYGTILSTDMLKGNLRGALDLLEEMKALMIEPNEHILTNLANLMENTEVDQASLLPQISCLVIKAQDRGVVLNTRAYNALLNGLAKHGHAPDAQHIYDAIFRTSICKPDIATYTGLVLAYINGNRIDEAMDIYDQLHRAHSPSEEKKVEIKFPKLDAIFYTTIISALSKRPTPSQSQHGDIFCEVYTVDGQGGGQFGTTSLQMALVLFHDMRRYQIRPNAFTYTTILHACGRARDAAALDEIHKLLKVDLYVDPDVAVYNSLMDAYNRVGDNDSVLDIWDHLHLSSLFDNTSVSIVLDSCGYNGQGAKARYIWKILQRGSMELNTNNYNSYIECLCRTNGRRGWNEAKQLIAEEITHRSRTDPPRVDQKTLNTLLSFARKLEIPSDHVQEVETWKVEFLHL